VALFGKKKDEDFEDEEGLMSDDNRGTRKLTRKSKDLQVEVKKKKKKEPPKPWGKNERLLVLVVLLATAVFAAVLAVSARGEGFIKVPNFDFRMPDFDSLNIFKEETIIIERKR
jgi:hypothetical protein